ncbi:ATP-binding cassette domain-containing protein [Pajaroellobacter abortibovis]|uniref:ABC transporter domain-containing protein n=1 Tax=Pajaroellobacter abortibovis TaxID=1882918 RepID=A0A1L6MVK7_9BACT|nr:ATP-binding cassette domain-containing protein [Pajaroellobacter abortibovis]APR99457.1 hypothetical protein BCY86_01240 [Pajaroellobacter abortibovis]
MLGKLEIVERPHNMWADAEWMTLQFAPAQRSGDIVLEAKKPCPHRGDRLLFQNLNLLIRRGDRLGIIGPNGSGKSIYCLF